MKKLKITRNTFIRNMRGFTTVSGSICNSAENYTNLRPKLFSQLYPTEVGLGELYRRIRNRVYEKIKNS